MDRQLNICDLEVVLRFIEHFIEHYRTLLGILDTKCSISDR